MESDRDSTVARTATGARRSLTAGAVKARALEEGFDLCGVARADRHPRLARLADWIASGHAGEMTYLAESLDERLDPAKVLPTARSVISLASVYNTPTPYSTTAVTADRVGIARYAWGDDYHDVIRARLRRLLAWMVDVGPPGLEAFSCVDNGPIQERVFAEQAGIGWIGKNTCVINAARGSWLFLAEIITSVELEPDAPALDQCGTCTRCLAACPTGALVEPYTLDATRCLSYLTIEVRGAVDDALRPAVTDRVVGCDICQDVCPWNRRAPESADPAWQPRDGLAFPRLIDLCRLSDDGWRQKLKGSALRRAGLIRIRRSLAYASTARPADQAAEALAALASHPSATTRVVAEALAWSQHRIHPAAPVTPVAPAAPAAPVVPVVPKKR